MVRRRPAALSSLRPYLVPQYGAWLLANGLLYGIVLWQMRSVVVEPGQGGWGMVFIWPDYWVSYDIQDIALSAPTGFTWGALLGNYLEALLPLYLVLNGVFNAVVPEPWRSWDPGLRRRRILLLGVVLASTFIPSVIFSYPGILLWVTMVALAAGTVAWGVNWRQSLAPG